MSDVSERSGILLENSRERAEYGCIVSFENADGKRLVLHAKGAPRQALNLLCDRALDLDPSFRVVGYSTPETVYQDLLGRRQYLSVAGDYRNQGSIEARALGHIGRGDMLARR